MKKQIHPNYYDVEVTCTSCGNNFKTKSTLKEIKVDVCANCHPFYTGDLASKNKAGRVERFNKKWNRK